MNPSVALAVVAVGFGGVAWVIERGEQKAKTCAVHDRRVGGVARILGILCGIVAVGLLATAFYFWRSGQ
jgi:hypothetical protein